MKFFNVLEKSKNVLLTFLLINLFGQFSSAQGLPNECFQEVNPSLVQCYITDRGYNFTITIDQVVVFSENNSGGDPAKRVRECQFQRSAAARAGSTVLVGNKGSVLAKNGTFRIQSICYR